MIETIWQDLRYAARSLRRTPAFTVAAVITLALGIGANTAIFSLLQAVLLRTLPLASPQELYFVGHGTGDDVSRSSNFRWYERVRQRTDVFEGVTAYNHRIFKVASDAGVETVFGQYVAGNYHGLLGVPIALGRGFTSENDRAPGSSPIAVISDAYWSRRFGRSPSALGQTLVVGGHPVTVVGVTAAGFLGLAPGDSIDITLPLSMRLLDEPDFLTWTDTWTSMPIVARLRPEVNISTASEALSLSYREYMAEPFNVDFRQTPDGQPTTAYLLPAARGDSDLREEYDTALQVLMGMVGLVLLIACVNVANLLLVRAAGRFREVAVRMSVGAARARLLRQFLTEGLLLSLLGGTIGFLLAAWGTMLISATLQTGLQPIVVDARPDQAVLLFTIGVSILTGLAFSVAPSLAAIRVNVAGALKGLPAASRPRLHLRKGMVATQVALCLVLVFGAGLLARTVQNLRTLDGGFAKDGVTVFALDARDTPVPRERLAPLCAEIIARLNERPDVLSGTCSTMSPVDTSTERRVITVDGVPARPGEPPTVYANSVDATYFETFGMEIVRGRGFLPQDNAAASLVAVIGEAAARRHFGDLDPIGRTFRWGRRDPGAPVLIVGMVRDARVALRDNPPPMIYTPLSQRAEPAADLLAAVRSTAVTPAIYAAVRGQTRSASPDVAMTYLRSMEEQIDAALVTERLLASLSGAFAALALLLACVGLYGVMSYDVTRQRRDIGVRLALGSKPAAVLLSVLQQTATVTAIGLAAGLLIALLASQAISAFLFGVTARDPITLGTAALVLAAMAMLAGYLPARRASRVDPATTLRAE